MEEINRGQLIYRQFGFTLDIVNNALNTLNNLKERIERRGSVKSVKVDFKDQIASDQPEAREINL